MAQIQTRFTVDLASVDQVSMRFHDVDRKVRTKAMQLRLREWAKKTRKVMRILAPKARAEYNRYNEVRDGRAGAGYGRIIAVEPGGRLRRSLGYRIKRYKKGAVLMVLVGGMPAPRRGMPGVGYDKAGWRAHFPEDGAYNRWHKRRLGRTRYRTKTALLVKEDASEAVRLGLMDALRAGGLA